MLRIAALVFALVVFAASVSFAGAPVNLTSVEAKRFLEKNRAAAVLDVRTPEEYRQAHLRDARLIPLSDLEKRVKEVPRDRPLLVYCAVGARSLSAARLLGAKGFRDIYHISDGLVGWYKNGFPIEKGRP